MRIIGQTIDDAAGEAFDKVARAIGLGYPGGPKIDKLSKEGNPKAIAFPKGQIADSPYDFSFSGVKSAVLNYLNQSAMQGIEINPADVAASFQAAVVEVLDPVVLGAHILDNPSDCHCCCCCCDIPEQVSEICSETFQD